MVEIVEDTLKLAKQKFEKFGFKEEQINQLISSGRKDLEQEIENLKNILQTTELDTKVLNDSLHALKGLLLNMGNNTIADKLIELKNSDDTQLKIEQIKSIFKF
jgi:tRNA A58 N-methylase Trm61